MNLKKLKIGLGADSDDEIVIKTKAILENMGFIIKLYGTINNEKISWVEIAKNISIDIQTKEIDKGIIFCYTGTGVTIVANRFQGVRASLCNTEEIAICAKKWNDSNILTMGIMSVDRENIKKIIDGWHFTKVDKAEMKNIRSIDN